MSFTRSAPRDSACCSRQEVASEHATDRSSLGQCVLRDRLVRAGGWCSAAKVGNMGCCEMGCRSVCVRVTPSRYPHAIGDDAPRCGWRAVWLMAGLLVALGWLMLTAAGAGASCGALAGASCDAGLGQPPGPRLGSHPGPRSGHCLSLHRHRISVCPWETASIAHVRGLHLASPA